MSAFEEKWPPANSKQHMNTNTVNKPTENIRYHVIELIAKYKLEKNE
jgi:hypothetical protein